MKVSSLCYVLFLILIVAFPIDSGAADQGDKDGVYIVYMGAAASDVSSKNEHAQLLSSVLKRRNNALVHSYEHGISGFAARLSEAEAQSIAKKPGVVSVFPDPVYHLHTTRSWDFLKYGTDVKINNLRPDSDSNSSSRGHDVIIGILDTGIWPESESFSDKDMGPIPSRWKGTCVDARDFNSTNCNRKLIGARSYTTYDDDDDEIPNTPRDMIGHGTHVASTAAGIMVPGASYNGLASGTAKGGSPGSRIAVYRICTQNGCDGSNILAAFNDAIKDGVDIVSLSVGMSSDLDFKEDPIAIGAFHAVENGITVVCSAGNDGPSEKTVSNGAPWILTVAATTIDRRFESNVVFGKNKVIKGEAINFASIGKSPVHPLIYAKSAKKADANESEARNCFIDTLDRKKTKGKIVICDSDDDFTSFNKMYEVKSSGGIGVVLIDDKTRGGASDYEEFPMTLISSKDAVEIFTYLNSTKNPVATILPTTTVSQYKPAPTIPYFSSRGPFSVSRNILKPDIAAPGAGILAAWTGYVPETETEASDKGKGIPKFKTMSGTSMSCPHVSGMAAEIKSQYPSWSPSAIKSAIMTTASQINNMKAPITTELGTIATAYDYGAGEMSTNGLLQPGLVYETTTIDYLKFLCYHGYNTSTIKVMSKRIPSGFACPKGSRVDLISDINYPSIAVFNLTGKHSRNITRTLTNVAGDGNTMYSITIEAPSSLTVTVSPTTLQFKKNGQRLSYQVNFTLSYQVNFTPTVSSLQKDVFGSIIWSSQKTKVRTPFVASSR